LQPDEQFEKDYNDAVKKFVNKYQASTIVEKDSTAKILNKVFPIVNHISKNEFNTIRKLEDKTAKSVPVYNETNYHTISHYVRKEPENITINNIVGTKTFYVSPSDEYNKERDELEKQRKQEEEDRYYMRPKERAALPPLKPLPHEFGTLELQVPNRPIIDINSTRLINSHFVDMVLTPKVDGADADRVRQVKAAVEEHNRAIEDWDHADKYDEDDMMNLKILRKDWTLQQLTYNWQKYECKFDNDKEDALIVATDVLYYVSDNDIYALADNLNEGTFMIGSIHIPKNFDTLQHHIIYTDGEQTRIEGTMILKPKAHKYDEQYYSMTDMKMIMEMQGNDHVYTHDVRFPELRDKRATILVPTIPRDYVIRAVVEHKIDTGATYHTTIKFIKIGNPNLNDLLDFKDLEDQESMALYQAEFTKCNGNYGVFKSKPPQVENEMYKMYIPKIVNTDQVIYVENPAYKAAKEQQVKAKILNTGKDYYVVTKKDGSFFCYNNLKRMSLKYITDTCDFTNVKPEIINKVNTKLTMAPQIDAQTIRSLVLFLNREEKDLPINVVLSIITNCLYQTVDLETQIKLIKEAGITGYINDAKADELKVLPTGWFSALMTGNFWKYLKINVGNAIYGESSNWVNNKVNPFI
jgi:hypothetical protein